ncbi:3-deoxy-D-manno-octulosonic acid transferase [Moraxella sp. ZJ142]|uniref:3-deoxy-D-manno-octulosonic acid transferase n=1 Tax=Moraxella marmotae TaxID=3344520 RepID=UPI0035D504AB
MTTTAIKPPLYYRVAINLLAPFYRQKVIKKSKTRATLKRELAERFGEQYLPTPKGVRGVIWCHAVSLGELNTAYPLLVRLLGLGYGLWVSSTTQTGFERAAKLFAKQIEFGRAMHSFVPVDKPTVLERFLDHVQPLAVMFIETELWANTLYACRRRGIKTMMVNARLTEKSYQGYAKFAKVSQTMMANLDGVIAQDAASVQRFTDLGAAHVALADSLKWVSVSTISDEQASLAKQATQQIAQAGKTHLWVMASTHDGEELLALQAHRRFLDKFADALLILVPRHPERFDSVYQLCLDNHLTVARRSLGEPITKDTQVYLADSMGELMAWYQVADIAVVGGSFVPVGGHNPIEPASLGKPIIMGSYDTNCHELVAALKRAGALAQLETDDGNPTNENNSTNDSSLAKRLSDALMQAYLYQWRGDGGAALVAQKQRALDDQLGFVLALIGADFDKKAIAD